MTDANKPRIVILSATGTARKRTIPAIRQSGICDVVGVHGRDAAKLRALADEFDVPLATTSIAELLDSAKADFVLIASPPSQHVEQINACLDRHLPILCEKPLCLSSEEANQIHSRSKAQGTTIRVAHHLRHQPGALDLRRLVHEGSLGALRRVSAQWSFWLNAEAASAKWKLDPKAGGSHAFFDAGIHVVDLLQYILPASPQSLSAIGMHNRFDTIHDNVSAVVDWGGAIVEMNASHAMQAATNDLLLSFEKGAVHVPHAFTERAFPLAHVKTATDQEVLRYPAVNPYGEEVRDFIGLLQGQPSIGTTLEEATVALKVLEAITTSISTGRTVSIGV